LEPGECQTRQGKACPLCYARPLEYALEVKLRNAALQRWWQGECPLEPLVESPRGRDYRTVSKRRMLDGRLGLIGERLKPLQVVRCRLEPPEHQELFDRLESSRHYAGLKSALQFAIVKGTYDQRWLLLNVSRTTAGVTAAARKLSAELGPLVAGLWLLEGKGDDYYSSFRSAHRIYGQERVAARFGERTFHYPVTVFSQVNHSIVPSLVEGVGSMLSGKPLVDLYCGYGLFGLSLPSPRVVGLELSAEAIRAAQANAKHFGREARLRTLDLTPERLNKELPGGVFEVIVDPPRGGPAPGLLAALAARAPARVVHLFCDVERAPLDLTEWRAAGYRAVRAVPFDLFPGTSELELAVCLERVQTDSRRTSRSYPSRKGGPK
jgi:tRNA/tmRNA/rRNA uracil-C5-methylase (TrmA/RlmC/RlmD family)